MHIGNRSTRTSNQRTESSGSVHGGASYCSIAWIARASEDHARRAKRSKRSSSALTSSKLKIDSFDVDLLAEVDDEYWDTGDPETDFKQPPGKPSKITAFNLMIRLSGIVARTLRTVVRLGCSSVEPRTKLCPQYSLDKADMPLGPFSQAVDPVVSQLNASLTEWVVSVPDHRPSFLLADRLER